MTDKTPAEQVLFRRIYARYHRPMRAYAERLMRSAPHLAEDVLQEAFWAVSRKMDVLVHLNDLQIEVYIQKAVKHAAWAMLSQEQVSLQRTVPYEEEFIGSGGDLPLDMLCSQEGRDEVLQVIHALPERYQRLLELYYVDGYALHEIAGLLRISYATARKRHERGRALLIRNLTAARQTSGEIPDQLTSLALHKEKQRKSAPASGVRTLCQVWAAAALCAVLCFGAASSPLLRASMVHIVKQVFPHRTHLQFSAPENTAITQWFTLQHLPEGYVLSYIARDDGAPSLTQRWVCTDGGYRYISLVQCGLGGNSILNTEGCTEQAVTINGCPGFLYTQENVRQKLIWSTGDSVFVLTVIGSDTGKVNLVDMAASLTVLK